MTVVAIVPAKNREDSVAATVRALGALGSVDRVLVVDDGSMDGTGAAAQGAGAHVLRLARNVGKGGAVAAGVAAAPDADVFLLIDADVGVDASLADRLLEPVLAGDADLVIGVLPPAGRRGGFGNVRRFARWGIRRGSGYEASAPLSGQRAVRAELLRDLHGAGRFGLEVAMTIDAVRRGARVREIEVAMEHRHTGRSAAGFRHRGAQGVDIARALWPRLVSRRARRIGLAGIVLVGLFGSYVTGSAAIPSSVPPAGGASKVIVFGIPHVGLDDVTPEVMPNLYRLSERGTFGMVTTRTGGNSTSAAGYATIGAGDRVAAKSASGSAYGRSEIVEGDPASAVVARRTGAAPRGAVLVPTMPSVLRYAGSHLNSKPGALGNALHRAHLTTAVVANSDTVNEDGTVARAAPAALALTTSSGSVDFGAVGHDLLQAAPADPFGVSVSPARFEAAVRQAVRTSDVVIVDPGETERANAYQSSATKSDAASARDAALTRTDRILGQVAARLPAHTMLLVVGVSGPSGGASLAPLVASGAGTVPGRFESPSTRRSDLVTLTDLAPTILDALGVEIPKPMIGQALRYAHGKPDRASMQAQDDLVQHRDSVYTTALDTFVGVQIALYLVALVVLFRRDTPEVVQRLFRGSLLTVAAWPIATFMLRAIPALYELGGGTHLLVWLLAAGLAWLAMRWRSFPLDPLLVVSTLGVGVLCLDMALGGPLQVSSLLGYTPTAAARFVGMGNSAFAVLAAGAVIACVALVARSDRPRDAWWLAAAVALAAVVADGAPWLGSDVGGILSLVPVLAIVLYLLGGRQLSVRVVALVAGAAALVLGVAVGFEALRAPDQRTHLGRFFLGGEGSSAWSTISRKWSTNIRVLTGSTWSWLIPLIVVFLLAVLVVGRGWLRVVPKGSPERIGLVGLLLLALLGWVVNDSGPVVAALVLVYTGPYVALLFLAGGPVAPELREPSAGHAATAVSP